MTRIPRPAAVATYVVLLVAWSAVIGIPNDPIGISLWIWLFTICWRIDQPRRTHLEFLHDWWPWLLALGFGLTFVLWSIAMLVYYSIRDRR